MQLTLQNHTRVATLVSHRSPAETKFEEKYLYVEIKASSDGDAGRDAVLVVPRGHARRARL